MESFSERRKTLILLGFAHDKNLLHSAARQASAGAQKMRRDHAPGAEFVRILALPLATDFPDAAAHHRKPPLPNKGCRRNGAAIAARDARLVVTNRHKPGHSTPNPTTSGGTNLMEAYRARQRRRGSGLRQAVLRKEDTMRRNGIAATLAALVIATSLGGCASWDSLSSRQQSTAVGAAVGGVTGAAVTNGNVLGTVGGAAIGGVIGDQVGKRR